MCRIGRVLTSLAFTLFAPAAFAAGALVSSFSVVSDQVEVFVIKGLGNNQTYTHVFENTGYTSAPIVICASSFLSSAEFAPVVRLNVTTSQVTVRSQRFDPIFLNVGNATVPLNQGNIFCIVATEGHHYDQETGEFWFTAGKNTVSTTHFSTTVGYNGMTNNQKWDVANDVEVTSLLLTASYGGVLSQIQTSNDLAAQVSFTSNCIRYDKIPFSENGGLCVGRHVGRDHPIRADEDVGYIAFVSGNVEVFTPDGIKFILKSGKALNSINGVGSGGATNISTEFDLSFAVVTQMAMIGRDGSFAAIQGTDPFAGQSAQLKLDESTNADRSHTAESVAWLGMSILQSSLSVVKDAYFSDDTLVPDSYKAQVGDALKYVYTISNTGDVPLSDILISDDHRGGGALEFQGCTFEINNNGSNWDTTASKLTKLGVSDVANCTATYEVTQADIDKQ